MSFLMHVVAHVSHYVVFYTTLPYLFIHSCELEFRNLDFFIPCRSLYRNLWFIVWNWKSDIIQPRYELFNACGGSCRSLPCRWHYVNFSFSPLSSSFGICIFSSQVVAYIVSFDSSSWNRKSDIIRPRYEVFNVLVAHLSHYVVFYTTLPYLFIHSSQTEFRNLDFFIPCRSLYRKLWFKLLNSKIRYHTATLWAF